MKKYLNIIEQATIETGKKHIRRDQIEQFGIALLKPWVETVAVHAENANEKYVLLWSDAALDFADFGKDYWSNPDWILKMDGADFSMEDQTDFVIQNYDIGKLGVQFSNAAHVEMIKDVIINDVCSGILCDPKMKKQIKKTDYKFFTPQQFVETCITKYKDSTIEEEAEVLKNFKYWKSNGYFEIFDNDDREMCKDWDELEWCLEEGICDYISYPRDNQQFLLINGMYDNQPYVCTMIFKR